MDGLRYLLREHHFLYWLHEGFQYDPDWNGSREVSRAAAFTKGSLPWGQTRVFRALASLFLIALKDVVFTTRQPIPLLGHHHSENGSFHTPSEPSHAVLVGAPCFSYSHPALLQNAWLDFSSESPALLKGCC